MSNTCSNRFTLLPQQAYVILHRYLILFQSPFLGHTVPVYADCTCSGYYHPQYQITYFWVHNLITWVGDMHGQRCKPLITLSTSRKQHDSNPHPQDYLMPKSTVPNR